MEPGATPLFVLRSDSPRFEIRSYRFLLEVVYANRKMVHFGRRISRPQDQKIFPKHELVIPVPFVYLAIKCLLVKIGGTLQIADLQRNVIDAVALKSCGLRRSRTGRQNRQ